MRTFVIASLVGAYTFGAGYWFNLACQMRRPDGTRSGVAAAFVTATWPVIYAVRLVGWAKERRT